MDAGDSPEMTVPDTDALMGTLDALWAGEALPALCDYIRIPNVSPLYCPTWSVDGHMGEAAALLESWAAARPVAGLQVEVMRLPGRTPVLVVDVPAFGPAGTDDETVLVYGHFDKQPGLDGWRAGLGPFTPVIEGDLLYGRGSSDDGYALFCVLLALEAAQRHGASHHRVVVLVEGSEESGSVDLPAYLDHLAPMLGSPSLVIGLDSEAPTGDRLWTTTSLRGLVSLVLRVSVLAHGVHSGLAGGVVPSSFRILRALLGRIEDDATGAVRLAELRAPLPARRRAELEQLAELVDAGPYPMLPGVQLQGDDRVERLVRVLWEPALEVTGAAGIPPLAEAGNVLRPQTACKASVRLPPTADAVTAAEALAWALESDPPHGAHVEVRIEAAEPGWDAPDEPAWLAPALDDVSSAVFGHSAARTGVGGSIPFIGMLGRRFPEAGVVVTGVLGPDSNPHGPDESLHLPTAKKMSAALTLLLDAHARRAP